MLIAFPAVLAVVALSLIGLGPFALAAAGLLLVWGFLTTPIPVAWNTWMTRVIPNQLEAGGALLVALIQFAITAGAASGGTLFDAFGWWAPFAFGGALLAASSVAATAAWHHAQAKLS